MPGRGSSSPRAAGSRTASPTTEPPDWIDLDHYVGEFERTGLTGALNRYRNADRDWEDLAAWDGEALQVPSLFIGGAQDASTTWMAEAIGCRGAPGQRTSSTAAGTGSSSSARTRSTPCCSNGSRAPERAFGVRQAPSRTGSRSRASRLSATTAAASTTAALMPAATCRLWVKAARAVSSSAGSETSPSVSTPAGTSPR